MTKMIVVDLDGTLLTSKKKVSDFTKKYLSDLRKQGYIVTIATGRFFGSVIKATDGARFADYVISDTGALIFDMNKRCAIFRADISSDAITKFVNLYNEDCVNQVDVSHHSYINRLTEEYFEKHFFKVTNNIDEVIKDNKNVYHMEVYVNEKDKLDYIFNRITNEIPELEIYIMQDSYSEYQWIEAMKKGCSKFNAISYLADYLGINNDDIIAFGDGLNDVDMIKNVGVGVAINSALDEVKNNAKYVTDEDNNNDGVAKFLMNYLNK